MYGFFLYFQIIRLQLKSFDDKSKSSTEAISVLLFFNFDIILIIFIITNYLNSSGFLL